MKTTKRYEKFLLKEHPPFPQGGHEGLNVVTTNTSPEEAIKNSNNIHFIAGVYQAACELFDMEDVFFCYSGFGVNFSIPEEGFNHFNHRGPEIQSPELDRDKLVEATEPEIAGAIIDLLLERKSWNHKVFSNGELKL